MKQLEARLGGELPPALRAFWSVAGGASLVDLNNYQHAAFWRDQGIEGAGHAMEPRSPIGDAPGAPTVSSWRPAL